ncbi:MAG: thioredoxin family protein [Anaerolineae bacterium]|nr:thioredoxin family protein [Anaerolineae bacterium]
MIERLLILAVLAALVALAYTVFRRWQVMRVARFAPGDPLLAARRPDTPAILYFTAPTCAPCRMRQRPALARLLDEWGDRVQVIEVNALDQTDAATRWGVLSVPTTFILDRQGRPRQVNYGVAGTDKLKGQLAGL